jgi:hypothetical protein
MDYNSPVSVLDEYDFERRSIADADVVLSNELSALLIETPLGRCLWRMRQDIELNDEGDLDSIYG